MTSHPSPEPAPAGPVPWLVLTPEAASVRLARAHVKDRCRSAQLSEDVCDTTILLTSEVVTNAVLHGRSRARLSVVITATTIHVEVTDDNSRHPTPVDPDTDALDGRGMAIVELLSAAWGVTDRPYGKTVWFDVDAG